MAQPIERVDFLIAGVQKGGTTALFDYLREHPALNLAPEKEVHFFDDDGLDWSRPDYGRYHARFEPGAGRLSGEATPIYLYWPDCLERIRAYNPRMKLILIFRDPVARAWSQWRMEFARGAETEPFGWCIRQGRERLVQAEKPGFHRVYSYVERGFYGAQMQRLMALFPPEQLLLLRSTDLALAPDATLGLVSRFLDVPPPGPVQNRRVHVTASAPPGEKMTAADVLHLREMFRCDHQVFEALLGRQLEPED